MTRMRQSNHERHENHERGEGGESTHSFLLLDFVSFVYFVVLFWFWLFRHARFVVSLPPSAFSASSAVRLRIVALDEGSLQGWSVRIECNINKGW